MWEIWSYAELPYAGMTNAKVKEQVNLGYRLPKPASCPDSIYKIMIDCWNKNVKRRVTMLAVNEALVMAWHEITGGEHDDAGNAVNTIYDNQQESENIYDNQQESKESKNAPDDSNSGRENANCIPIETSHYSSNSGRGNENANYIPIEISHYSKAVFEETSFFTGCVSEQLPQA